MKSTRTPISRIVIVGPFWPYRGGIAHFNELLARKLHLAGYRVHVLNFRFQYPSFFFPGSSQFEPGDKAFDFPVERILHSLNPVTWYQTGRKIRSLQPDLIIFRFWLPLMAPALGWAARFSGRKAFRLAITDNIVPHEKRPFDKMLTRFFTRSVDGFATLSKAVLQDLRKVEKSKPAIELFHPLYEQFGSALPKIEARKTLHIPEEERVLLFFGFIREYKGLDLLLKALGSEKIRSMNIRLIIAGEYYEDPEPYRQLIMDHGLTEQVTEVNRFIPDEDVRHYFCAADCVVQPYKSATQSGVTQIAYFYEKPMIVTRVSGLPELIPDDRCGFVVDPEPESIAVAIKRFFNESKAAEWALHIREKKKMYSWDRFIKELLQFGIKHRGP